MKIALLGLPQSGKRTLFALLTGRHVHAPAKAGESIEGHAPVRDPRVDRIAEIVRPRKKTYAETVFQLCPDVQGGTARDWLDAARRCDAVCFVVRAFSSGAVYHARTTVDPVRDRRDLSAELILSDLELVETRLARIAKEKKAGLSAAQKLEESVLEHCRLSLEAERPLTGLSLDAHQIASIRSLGLLTLKPVLWILNVDEGSLHGDGGELRVSVLIEEEIAEMADPSERLDYLRSIGLSEAGVDRFNASAYESLGLMSFYTMGEDEARAWTIRKGSLAPEAAGKIHTDMERGFIRVEVIKYDDLVSLGSEKSVREHGRVLLKGKDYVIEDGDICNFLFNV
jgi:ribosome-binding ATPase YchF (GTP1/OBG family)